MAPRASSRCSRALYKDQPNWVGKIQTVPQDQLEGAAEPAAAPADSVRRPRSLPVLPGLGGRARRADGQERAVPEPIRAQVNQLVQMNGDATQQFPDFQGTPTFIINGKMVEDRGRLAGLGISSKASAERGTANEDRRRLRSSALASRLRRLSAAMPATARAAIDWTADVCAKTPPAASGWATRRRR